MTSSRGIRSVLLHACSGVALATLGIGAIPAAAQVAGHPAQAKAQNPGNAAAPAEDNQDIVVTAQRRKQRIQDVGIAISAFSGDQLQARGITNSIDIARLSPGVSISGGGGGQVSQFSIRGVTQNDFNDTVEAPVAVYVDETYVPNINGQIFGTLDLERVEILKGPQGTLFGRNATGGLVHFVPRQPTPEADGFAEVTYGRFNHARLEAATGGPISDTLEFRISGFANHMDPILKNIYTGNGTPRPPSPCCQNEWNDNSQAGRVQLKWSPTSDLTVRLTGSVAHTLQSENPYNQVATVGVFDAQGRLIDSIVASPTETRIAIGPGGIAVDTNGVATTARRPVAGGDLFGFVAPSAQSLTVSKDFARDDLNHSLGYDGALHVAYDLGGAELVSISNYRRFDKFNGTDVDAGPTNLIDYISDSHQESVSQELRLSGHAKSLNWVAGAYYLYIDTKVKNGFKAPINSIFASSLGFGTTGVDLTNNARLRKSSISGFGQVDYTFAPRLTFVLGARVIRENQKYSFRSDAYTGVDDYTLSNGTPLFTLQPSYADDHSVTLWAGKAQLEYRPTGSLLLYAGVNRGVKGGGYNDKLADGTAPTPTSQFRYDPETLMAYEAGFKLSTPGNLVTIDGSAYYYDYSNYQAFTFANVSGVVTNRDARTYGVELSINANPAEGLNIGVGASLVDAKVKDVVIAPGVVVDTRPTFTPKAQIASQFSYRLPLEVARGSLTIGGDASWRDAQYDNLRNFHSDLIAGYFLANARIGWADESRNWNLSVGLDNIFDRRYRTVTFNLSTLCGCTEESYGMPRMWNLTLRRRW